MLQTHVSFQQSKINVNGQKKNQSIEAKNPTFLVLLQPDWFLLYGHAFNILGEDHKQHNLLLSVKYHPFCIIVLGLLYFCR